MFQDCRYQWRACGSNAGFSVVLAGDCCPQLAGTELIHAGRTAEIAAEVLSFFEAADLRIIQWETPLAAEVSPIIKSGPNLICRPECIELAKTLHIDLALLANNHVGDQGGAAVLETLRHFKSAGIAAVGAGADAADAVKPQIMECRGFKIGILNFAEHEFGTAAPDGPGVAPVDILDNLAAVRSLRGAVDFLLVMLHGGHEYYPFPSPRMVKMQRALADAGADLVFNCHTHCPLGVETRRGKPIFYGPGNFYFPSAWNKDLTSVWYSGFVVRVDFDAAGAYGMELLPIRFDDRVHILPPERRRLFLEHLKKLCAPLGDMAALQRSFESWCTVSGTAYLGNMRSAPLLSDGSFDFAPTPENLAHWVDVRNLFSCESHHDLVLQTLRLIEEGRLDEARARWPEIEPLTRASWLE